MSSPKKKFTPFEAMDEDLWYEIFERLPIKTLCRFRCVCKWFNSLISSPLFIDLHYSSARSGTPRHLKPYLHVEADRGYLVELRFPDPGLNDVVEHSRQPLYFPFRADRENGTKGVTFLGVIHGVVCFSYNRSSSSPSVLWKPTIHKHVTLPCLRLCVDQQYAISFGYDTSGKDFKVVLIRSPQWTYKVYSNRQGSWSRARGVKLDSPWSTAGGIKLKVSWDFNGGDSPCFVNGTIHWGLSIDYSHNGRNYRSSSHSVLMFDCESEEFKRMALPTKLFWAWPVPVKLFEYAGMLAALVDTNRDLYLWVMEEHGVATSWKKLYMIPNYDRIVIYDPSFEKLAPYGPSNTWNMVQGCILDVSTEIASEHVYDETMLLMDHSKAQSYTNQEIVTILSS